MQEYPSNFKSNYDSVIQSYIQHIKALEVVFAMIITNENIFEKMRCRPCKNIFYMI